MLVGKVPLFHPTSAQLLPWGANFGPLTLGGQPWRLVTSVFLHIGIVHLLLNMWCLWNLGELAEGLWKRTTLLAIFLLSGIAGAMFSLWWHPFVTVAGASGAIFGVAGALISYFLSGHHPYSGRAAKVALVSLIVFAIYNLVFGFLTPGIDNASHVGGFVVGLVLGLVLARSRRQGHLLAAAAVVIVAVFVIQVRAMSYVVHLQRGRVALELGQPDKAIAELGLVIRQKPSLAEAQLLIGESYLATAHFAQAEAAFRRGLELKPGNSQLMYRLGMSMLMQGRSAEALNLFQEQARREPRNPEPLIGTGIAAARQGDLVLAVGALRRAVQIDPWSIEANYNLGVIALRAGLVDEALAAFARAAQLRPNDPATITKLGDAYKAKGMYAQAEAAYERARKLSPRSQDGPNPRAQETTSSR